jgi:hypothetical protein
MKRLLVGVALLLTALLSAACGESQKTPAASGTIAVLDQDKAMAAHYLYPAWRAAKDKENAVRGLKEQEAVRAGLRSFGAQDVSAAQRVRAAQDDIRISQARLAERARLNELERLEKEQINKAVETELAVVEEEYRLPLFNLKTNLEALAPMPRGREAHQARQQELIRELDKLRAEKAEKLQAVRRKGETLLRERLRRYEEEAAVRLGETRRQIKTGGPAAYDWDDTNRLLALPEAVADNLASLENQLTAQQILAQQFQDRIYEDILSQVTKIALQNNISAVLTFVRANAGAVDITDEVIANLPGGGNNERK